MKSIYLIILFSSLFYCFYFFNCCCCCCICRNTRLLIFGSVLSAPINSTMENGDFFPYYYLFIAMRLYSLPFPSLLTRPFICPIIPSIHLHLHLHPYSFLGYERQCEEEVSALTPNRRRESLHQGEGGGRESLHQEKEKEEKEKEEKEKEEEREEVSCYRLQ